MTKNIQPLLLVLFFIALWSCGKKTDDPAAVSTPNTSNTLPNISAAINDTLTVLYGDLVASASKDGSSFIISGSRETYTYGAQTIAIKIATGNTNGTFDINTLKGIHNSGNKFDKTIPDLSISYEQFQALKSSDKTWYTKDNCSVEITSTTAPYIEGTFSAGSNLQLSGSAPVSIKKGTFKLKYQ